MAAWCAAAAAQHAVNNPNPNNTVMMNSTTVSSSSSPSSTNSNSSSSSSSPFSNTNTASHESTTNQMINNQQQQQQQFGQQSQQNLNLLAATNFMANQSGLYMSPLGAAQVNPASLYSVLPPATGSTSSANGNGGDHRSSSIAALRLKAREHSVALGTI